MANWTKNIECQSMWKAVCTFNLRSLSQLSDTMPYDVRSKSQKLAKVTVRVIIRGLSPKTVRRLFCEQPGVTEWGSCRWWEWWVNRKRGRTESEIDRQRYDMACRSYHSWTGVGRRWKFGEVSCTERTSQRNDFQLTPTVKMETRYVADRAILVVNVWRSIIIAELWRYEVASS